MNLRLTTLLIVVLTFAGLALVLSVTTRVVLLRHFEEVEQQNVLINLERTQGVFEVEFETLERISREWAGHVESPELPVDADTLSSLNISFVLLLDADGDPLSGLQWDGEQMVPIPASQVESFITDSEYLSGAGSLQGVVAFADHPLLLVSQPVSSAPDQGILLVGRALDSEGLEWLGAVIQLPVELIPYQQITDPDDRAASQAFMTGEDTFVYVVDEARIAGYGLLLDPRGDPSYLLRIEQSRLFYLSGQRVMGLISVALVTVGIVFALITILFLELMVTSRLARLGKEVNAIRASEFLTQRVSVSRRDELARLGKDINAMLDALELSQVRRLEAQEELTSRVDDLLTLNSTAVLLLGKLDTPNTQEMVCKLAVEHFGVDLAWIGTPTRDRAWIQPVAAFGCPVAKIAPLPLADTGSPGNPVRQAVSGAPASLSTGAVECAGERWESQAAFSLPVEQGSFALLNLYSREGAFSTERLQILEAFSNLASVALQNALLFRQVRNGRKRLEMLSRRLVELQEEERKRIAMELHDEIGQILTGLNLMLGADLSELPPPQRERQENARQLVNDLIGRVRQMSLTLRPAMLDDLGLLPTLLWHFENYTRQTGIHVQFQHDALAGERFSPELETAAYRVIQEALTNVARHAGVEEVLVQIWVAGGIFNAQVEDAGRGFDPEKVAQTPGTFGLLGMQERAIALRGSLTIDSQPERGTVLLMQLPLEGTLERRSYGRNHSAGR